MKTINAEYIIDTIFNIRDYPEDYDNTELLEYIDSLIEEIKNNKNLPNELKEILDELSINLKICPDCREKLQCGSYKENHNEISEFGHSPYENADYLYCSNCDWTNRYD